MLQGNVILGVKTSVPVQFNLALAIAFPVFPNPYEAIQAAIGVFGCRKYGLFKNWQPLNVFWVEIKLVDFHNQMFTNGIAQRFTINRVHVPTPRS